MGGSTVEMHYSSENGHVWILRYERSDLRGAVEAVFRWFVEVREFEPKDLAAFIVAILNEAVEMQLLTSDGYRLAASMMKTIPKTDLTYAQQVNLMRMVMLAAVDSTA